MKELILFHFYSLYSLFVISHSYGVATMSRTEILGASGGMAVHMTYRVEMPDAPPLNGEKSYFTSV